MKTKSKTFLQILQGFFSSIAVFLSGYILSGRISIIENIEFYPAGKLVFAFPFVFALLCILIAKYSVKTSKKTYFKASFICLSVPVFVFLFSLLLAGFIELTSTPSDTHVGNQIIPEGIQLLLLLPGAPLIETYYHLFLFAGNNPETIKIILMNALFFIPIILGLLASVIIYRRDSKKFLIFDN